ncbi:MAG: hypothetical protein B7X28_04780 [Halothiobacillus sp. 13-55-253]|nr:MAG: hypothetical protein B7X28_04780 [Halothiobacillus sp. 13-55-253]
MIRATFIIIASMMLATAAQASEGYAIPLKQVSVDLSNKAALYRGALTFQAQCATCHTAKYMRYGRVASDLDLSRDQAKALLPPKLKLGDEMVNFMPADYAKQVFGIEPPDLSLIARVRGADWLYTYLTSFYADPTKRWGVNNAIFPDVNMPDVFAAQQGVQEPVYTDVKMPDGSIEKRLSGLKPPVIAGSMPPAEFNTMVKDLVSYMVYMSEPAKIQRMAYGPYVLGFTVLMFFLKKEYWRDIKQPES